MNKDLTQDQIRFHKLLAKLIDLGRDPNSDDVIRLWKEVDGEV
jgi:hypothetical protein